MNFFHNKKVGRNRGFTLIQALVALAIFSILIATVYQTIYLLFKQGRRNSENTTLSYLASQYLEVARNIPFAQIGTMLGNPHGNLPDQPNALSVTYANTTYQVYYEVTYVDDPADGTILLGTDPVPDDYKQVKLSVKNTTTNKITNFSTNVVPTGLESLASGGALFISVIDSVGQPVSGASINITNTALAPQINLTRTSNAQGKWAEVGLPNSALNYHITVTKNGYSSDQTYPSSGGNPNPIKPDATVANGQVTQVSFAIDQTSNLTFNTLNQTCGAIGSVGLQVKGSKLIGTPSVIKYDNTFTSSGAGQVVLSGIEWDNYTPTLTGGTYTIYGSSPIQEINLLANTTQLFNLILGPKTPQSLLVIVKDASTGNSLEGASVALTNSSPSYSNTLTTGGSIWRQSFWNGGSGQADYTDTTKYWQDDGGISTTDTPLAMRLINSGGNTLSTSGVLESSTFDTGTASSSYTTLDWQPTSQDPAATVKFQIATNNDNLTWNFVGPDGTASTYYTSPSGAIASNNDNKRYARYKAYLSTADTTKNPTVTSVSINYVSGCFTPGQVFFPSLASSSNYQIVISMPGYTTKTITNLNITDNNLLQVLLAPS